MYRSSTLTIACIYLPLFFGCIWTLLAFLDGSCMQQQCSSGNGADKRIVYGGDVCANETRSMTTTTTTRHTCTTSHHNSNPAESGRVPLSNIMYPAGSKRERGKNTVDQSELHVRTYIYTTYCCGIVQLSVNQTKSLELRGWFCTPTRSIDRLL